MSIRAILVLSLFIIGLTVGVAWAACGANLVVVKAASVSSGLPPVTVGSSCAEAVRLLQEPPARLKITAVAPSAATPDGVVYTLDSSNGSAVVVCGS